MKSCISNIKKISELDEEFLNHSYFPLIEITLKDGKKIIFNYSEYFKYKRKLNNIQRVMMIIFCLLGFYLLYLDCINCDCFSDTPKDISTFRPFILLFIYLNFSAFLIQNFIILKLRLKDSFYAKIYAFEHLSQRRRFFPLFSFFNILKFR